MGGMCFDALLGGGMAMKDLRVMGVDGIGINSLSIELLLCIGRR